ncbi:hypothetical protein [Mycobacterium dioxanotrophicus]|uniref:hypothetical protein n=1 Tax=Mycobacterium dioxanotrophicus TaxID=482462 RepID=UPI001E308B1A|nr:hypothetical protein [Mycobacterium dioxanotrophicus]
MTGPTFPVHTAPRGPKIPDGFFDEIAATLETETAEEISEAVIAACTGRGILHPELEEDPDDELRAEEIAEVFALLAEVTAAVADGTIIPSRVRPSDDVDGAMAAAWESFAADAADASTAEVGAAMLTTGRIDNNQIPALPKTRRKSAATNRVRR